MARAGSGPAGAERIKVICRVRPPLSSMGEWEADRAAIVQSDGSVRLSRSETDAHSFSFSAAYGEDSTQEEIYKNELRHFIERIWQGQDATAFCYGASGSGKTHTVTGAEDEAGRGLIPRALMDICAALSKFRRAADRRVTLSISYLELWRDTLRDLLYIPEPGRKAPELSIRQASDGRFHVAGLSELPITSFYEFEEIYSAAAACRATGSTKINAQSSRSHAVLNVIVRDENLATGQLTEGKLSLIDLAGSESNKHTGNGGNSERMQESIEINKSLSILRQVVNALNKGDSRIPYRDSKLTKILSSSLGGDAAGLLVCNIAPGSTFYETTLQSLRFAALSANVENQTSSLPKASTSRARPAPPSASEPPANRPRTGATTTARPPSAASRSLAARGQPTRPQAKPPTGRLMLPRSDYQGLPPQEVAELESKMVATMQAELEKQRELFKHELQAQRAQMTSHFEASLAPLQQQVAGLQGGADPRRGGLPQGHDSPEVKALLLEASINERKGNRDGLEKARELYRKAYTLQPRPRFKHHIDTITEALRRQAPLSATLFSRTPAVESVAQPASTTERELVAPKLSSLTSQALKLPAARRPLGELRTNAPVKVVAAHAVPTKVKRVLFDESSISQESELSTASSAESPGTSVATRAGGQTRDELERAILDIFNSGDAREIQALNGIGKRTAEKIADLVDEEGEMVSLRPSKSAGLTAKIIDKLLAENGHLIAV